METFLGRSKPPSPSDNGPPKLGALPNYKGPQLLASMMGARISRLRLQNLLLPWPTEC